MKLPKNHPRYASLRIRHLVEDGVRNGITSMQGLIAHGRGEAFDYLLGEKTNAAAKKAIEKAAKLLANAKQPVISVNGNTAALVPKELAQLSKVLDCPLEINIFNTSKKREAAIKKHLKNNGAANILMPEKNCTIKYISSNRKYVNKEGIKKADVVFVPLEDGDRTESLVKNCKKVIVVDLNHLSRSAKKSTVCIVDNIVRCMPLLIKAVQKLQK